MHLTPIDVQRLGMIPYAQAWDLQTRLAAAVASGEAPNTLLLVQHPAVYTTGRGGKDTNLLTPPGAMLARGAEFHRVDRGGDVTFHGPGQLVAYPIVALPGRERSAVWYVRTLEAVAIEALAEFGILGTRVAGRSGVWVEGAGKICAIGVRISRGVTSHGFALNVSTDLSWFENIVPCGLVGSSATSMQKLLGESTPAIEDVEDAVVAAFESNFNARGAPAGGGAPAAVGAS
ncbi:MAG: lipoyl(octanoyl) transferase LipB [Dehalococcoidia bacterium]|nr:lipoyl(octanoyl) transferase LipB [Dehalococcoidia bacterium]